MRLSTMSRPKAPTHTPPRPVVSIGDAEGLLWDAPRSRVVRRHHGTFDSSSGGGIEIHALLAPDGLPLAWWERHALVGKARPAEPLPYAIPHQSIYSITARGSERREVDLTFRNLFVEAFIDALARAADRDPCEYRCAMRPASSRASNALDAARRAPDSPGDAGHAP